LLAAGALPPVPHTQLERWSRAVRLPLLVCALAPVVVAGAALWAQGARISLVLLADTLAAASLLMAGANLLDAYLEHVRNARLAERDPATSAARALSPLTGSLGASGVYPLDALRVAILLLVAGAVLGIPLAVAGGWPVGVLGVVGLAAALFYSATSYALKRVPLGELAVLLALGPGLVTVTVLAQRRPLTPMLALLGLGLGLFATGVLEANNLRALAPEIRDGRVTLVRLLGQTRGRLLFVGCLLGAYALAVAAALAPGAPHGVLAVLFSLPVAVLPLTGGMRARSAAPLNLVVEGAVQSYIAFAAWLAIGLLLSELYVHLLSLIGG
jgi:1,4-dihydroxy-2-naphthoate octaprenyltransferase